MTPSDRVAASFRARLLCEAAEPHTENAPCDKHLQDARRQLAIAGDVASVRQ